MICHRIGRSPIGTIGLGRNSVSSRKRVPNPPQKITTFIAGNYIMFSAVRNNKSLTTDDTDEHRCGNKKESACFSHAAASRISSLLLYLCSSVVELFLPFLLLFPSPSISCPSVVKGQTKLTASRVRAILGEASKTRILVIGDVMLDHFIWGSVARISPEAPVPVVDFERESFMPGGAANVARNLAALNVPTELFGLVGEDSPAQEIRSLLAQQNINC